MKLVVLLSTLLISSPVVAKPLIPSPELIVINPAVVCADLFQIDSESDPGSYESWRSYQYCIQYMKRADESVK